VGLGIAAWLMSLWLLMGGGTLRLHLTRAWHPGRSIAVFNDLLSP